VQARCCYGASYDYFFSADGSCPSVYRPWATHDAEFCTMISPCPAKGLSLLLELAHVLPAVKFAVVPTAWTSDVVLALLREALPNITVLDASPAVDDIYSRTRVLVAPSIWPEAFGLVVMEAELRGIPAVSTTHGGLVEAQMDPELAVPVSMFYDRSLNEIVYGKTMDEMEDEVAARAPPPLDADAGACRTWHQRAATLSARNAVECLSAIADESEASPMAMLVGRLMTDDTFLHAASERAQRQACHFVRQHAGTMARILEDATKDQNKFDFTSLVHLHARLCF